MEMLEALQENDFTLTLCMRPGCCRTFGIVASFVTFFLFLFNKLTSQLKEAPSIFFFPAMYRRLTTVLPGSDFPSLPFRSSGRLQTPRSCPSGPTVPPRPQRARWKTERLLRKSPRRRAAKRSGRRKTRIGRGR